MAKTDGGSRRLIGTIQVGVGPIQSYVGLDKPRHLRVTNPGRENDPVRRSR